MINRGESLDKLPRFCGTSPTTCCRVCGGSLSSRYVESGRGPYESRWICCAECGSWSIAWEPQQQMLDIFYGDYLKHCKLSAVNRDNNDGRRYTQDYRPIRERDYTLGISDLGLMLEPGFSVLDFGAQDEVFLDVCIRLQPALARTVAMDYGIEAHNNDRHFFQSIDEFYLGDTLYDIVTLWDVYEHIPDLNMFFVALAKRVVRGGKVLVQTPRSDLYADALGSLWHHFLPVQHLQLPSRLGIVLQFGRYGFKLVKGSSFGANAPPSVIPDPYKSLFDRLAKIGDLGSTQILLFQKD